MTPAERVMAEKTRIGKSGQTYLPPYRMARLMETAGKIMNLMVRSDTNICYEECNIILALVAAGIASVSEEEDDFT